MTFLFTTSSNTTFAASVPQNKIISLQEYIGFIEKQHHIPAGLLAAIARVESGCKPYAVNIAGRSLIAKNRDQALYQIKRALASGITNVDIGVMQVNYRWHKEGFKSIEKMLNPKTNIIYAANLLSSLHKKHGTWHKALRYYH